MNKILQKSLHTGICLSIGFSLGLNLTEDISTVQSKLYERNFSKEEVSQIKFYDNMIQNVNAIEIYNTSEMTEEILTDRNGKIIVEKVVGEVTNYRLDGEILNASTGNGTYINYQRVDGAKEGDKIVTYFIYNPFSNEQDDILTRMDFVIDDNEI